MRYVFLFVVLLLATPAEAASYDAPKRKSGLWELKMTSGQAKGMPAMQQCVDEKTDDLMQKEMSAAQKTQCSKNDMRKEGDKIVVESVCKMENSTATTRAVFTGRFDSAYKADIKSTFEPPLKGMKESSSVQSRPKARRHVHAGHAEHQHGRNEKGHDEKAVGSSRQAVSHRLRSCNGIFGAMLH